MPSRRKRRNNDNFFFMKTPVILIIGLGVSVGPAIAIAAKHDLGWFGIISASLLCAVCVGIPLTAREIAGRLDGDHETHRPTSGNPDSTTGLDGGSPVDGHPGDPHRCCRGGSVPDHHRRTEQRPSGQDPETRNSA